MVRYPPHPHPEQRAEAPSRLGKANFLSAGKKLLDNGHPAYKAVTTIRVSGFALAIGEFALPGRACV